jgi:hypothetical protein
VQLYFHLVSSFRLSKPLNGSNALTYSAREAPAFLSCTPADHDDGLQLLPHKRVQGAVRITAYMVLACLVIGNSLMSIPVKLFTPNLHHVSLLVYSKERY